MNKRKYSKLLVRFSLIIFTTIVITCSLVTSVWILLSRLHLITPNTGNRYIPIFMFLLGSLLIGAMIAFFTGERIVRPIQNISDAFDELSKGNFSVRMSCNQKVPEIQQMAEKFNAAVYDLSRIETLRDDFVVNVSHEFKTPIAAIEGYATLLQDESLGVDSRNKYISKILENSSQLSNLTSNILTLSKLENQEIHLHMETYRLDEQIRKNILLLENKWNAKNIQFDIELSNIVFLGNEQLLNQVWFNILDNAIKHSPDFGTIYISQKSLEHGLSISIKDCGEGIPPDIQKHIFEKFYQGDSSRKSEGNGLGLALAKRVVDLYKGTIQVKSSVGNGAEFVVFLPTT